MAGISKKKIKKNGKEFTKYTVTYRDITGKQHTTGLFDTRQEALREAKKYDKKQIHDKSLTIGKALDLYIKEVKLRGRAKSTIDFYEGHKKNALSPYVDIKYNKMTKADWRCILYEIRNKVSATTANGCHRTLRAVFKFLKDEEIITDNSFEGVKPLEAEQREFNHFEPDEILRLLDICKKKMPDFYPMFFTFIGTGMREGEIFGLLKENLHLDKGYIKVCTQFTGGEFKRQTKTKRIRNVFLFPTLTEVLKEHLKKDTTNSPFVFHNKVGNCLNQSNVRSRFWVKLLKEAGYPENYARMHDLRGSNTDLAIAIGLSITFAKDQLGHTSENTTLKNYLKTNNAMRRDGAEKLDAFFSKCENNVRTDFTKGKNNVILFRRKTDRA